MEPPQIVRYRTKKARLTNRERNEINEYGLKIPSNKPENYESNLGTTTVLLSSDKLPGSRQFNYKVKATANRNNSRQRYLQERSKAEAKAEAKAIANTNKNTKKRPRNNNNNGTRRTLF